MSYLVFTKKLPHVLGRPQFGLQMSQFYRLFRDQLYGLGTYSDPDARQMLDYLNYKAGNPIGSKTLPADLGACRRTCWTR